VTDALENLSVGTQRTRRNIVKMASIMAPATLASAVLARTKPAQAAVCAAALRCNCFLKGTRILTAEGECKVEDLAIGDVLPAMFGGTRTIQWIGRYPLKKSDRSKPWVRDAWPVRIAPSALAPSVPRADLYVTGWHALFIDGLLVPAGYLINGTTITRYEARAYDELEFFHIKLESHDVIYAEGAPVETLLEVDERAVNFAEYFRRYGPPNTKETPCAPLVSLGGRRGELKSRIRSAISPWIDRREHIDVIRDHLEERGIMLSRQSEPVH
jgi:Hint domain-containing protein